MEETALTNFTQAIANFIKKHRKLLTILTIITILVAVIFFIIEATRNATLQIAVTPTDSTITINGKQYHNGLYRFHPGTYTATISRSDFDSKEVTIKLISNKTVILSEYLTQNGDLSYYTDHKTDFIALQNIYNTDIYTEKPENLNTYFDNYKKVVDLRNQLPITEFISNPNDPSTKFAILIKEDTGVNCEQPLCLLIIDETERLHDQALNLLKTRGFNPDDYPIRYSNSGADF